ncbi:MAG: DUF4412 domain-containing protein [Crocinitomicaceae bacterium]|nr:DUF4412 domain-containing protein [Crocinitomicaceae bacterium]
MKKLVVLFAVTILTSVMSFAQMKEGSVSYDIEVSSDKEEMAMAVMMMNGSSMDLYFSDDKARTELDMGSMMSMSTVVDNVSGEVLILMGGMMGNKAIVTSSEEMDVKEEEAPEYTVTLTKEKKEIAGYKCKKAVVTDEDGNEMEYWYTEEIETATTDSKSAIAQLPGLALEYSTDREGLVMSFTASKVETSLDNATKASKFEMTVPDGYEEMTFEEFSSMGM